MKRPVVFDLDGTLAPSKVASTPCGHFVGGIMVHAIDEMDLPPPQVSPDDLEALVRAKKQLLAE